MRPRPESERSRPKICCKAGAKHMRLTPKNMRSRPQCRMYHVIDKYISVSNYISYIYHKTNSVIALKDNG